MQSLEENVDISTSDTSSFPKVSDLTKNKFSSHYGRGAYKRYHHNQDNSKGKRKKFEVGKRLKEVDVGITEYYFNHEGFSGTIKERYSDFHVHEIAPNGQIAKLSNQELPPELKDLEDLEKIYENVPESVQKQIQLLSVDDSLTSSIKIDVTNMSKEYRRAIHVMAKTIPNLISRTETNEGGKMITVSKVKCRADRSSKSDRRVDWSKRGGDYCHFILHKINMDTMDALNRISSFLRLRANSFSYAGTKDRRAKTTQWVSVKKIDPKDILRAAKSVRGLFVGNFKFDASPLKLGRLSGNRFTIVLRNVVDSAEKIEKAMIALRDNGFINYFGLQRFGTIADIPTHEIGRALLQGNWQEAIHLILKPRECEQDKRLVEARQIYNETGDPKAAYKKLDRIDKIEAKILSALHLHGNNNPQAVLSAVSRNTILMYLHAYQSFVWNQVVSKRISVYGIKPIIGDLVYANPNTDEIIESSCLDKPESPEECDTMETEVQHNLPKVKILKQDDLNNFSLEQVIMPQPGWKVVYPPYALSWYKEFLGEDGLTTDLKQKNKKYTLGGSYRRIIQVPLNLTWSIVQYNEPNEDLVASDIDEVREVQSFKSSPGGKYKALIIAMALPSSTYATMALREVLKADTSAESQAAQSAKYHEPENNKID
ncbi:pseudouridylate synthase 7 homolog [Belonocnema kinseyi]|uniref:pseudouridylate synthase 7 homolog n=1 Tax=Belonocnema kinseyi TaxID=2817044 RepID=UPI00143D43E6|nr:pseudouridylate synthase 7 homolog [Belonocnema kinseyi]XP_033228409.1 pseudouridylate synthase 7 homolog [Belonocnema kinseyi]XP_033228410.1 pseudouridylate synthase 7 homolog [Belonocnema kinseyi]